MAADVAVANMLSGVWRVARADKPLWTPLAKVNLAAPATSYRNVIGLPRISLRTTKVTVRVLTSGKTVQIDGLATSRV